MKRIVPLDMRGRRHLQNELAYFGALGKQILRCVDLDGGVLEAIVPFDSSEAAYQFRRSGLGGRSGEGNVDPVVSTQGELLDGIVGGLQPGGAETVLLVESLMMAPDDVPLLPPLSGDPMVVGSSVVLTTRAGATRRELDELLGVVYAVPGGLGVLTHTPLDGLRLHTLDGLVERAVRVFLGAYDGEGVISWRPRAA